MNRFAMMIAGLGIAVTAIPTAASAAPWTSINQRQRTLDARIDQGVRAGTVSRSEAVRLRTSFRDLVWLENRYRANGLSSWERNDLNRRFDSLSARIRIQKHDRNRR